MEGRGGVQARSGRGGGRREGRKCHISSNTSFSILTVAVVAAALEEGEADVAASRDREGLLGDEPDVGTLSQSTLKPMLGSTPVSPPLEPLAALPAVVVTRRSEKRVIGMNTYT